MKRDETTFAEIGEALFGPNWQRQIGRTLDVSERTIRYWVAGTYNIPEGVWNDLAALCRRHARALDKWAERINGKGE